MDIAVTLLIGTAAVVAWFLLAALIALIAGRVIRRRDAHDLPVDRGMRMPRTALAPH